MTLTIDVPPEKEAAYQALAQAQGLSVEQWLTQLADQAAPFPGETVISKPELRRYLGGRVRCVRK